MFFTGDVNPGAYLTRSGKSFEGKFTTPGKFYLIVDGDFMSTLPEGYFLTIFSDRENITMEAYGGLFTKGDFSTTNHCRFGPTQYTNIFATVTDVKGKDFECKSDRPRGFEFRANISLMGGKEIDVKSYLNPYGVY